MKLNLLNDILKVNNVTKVCSHFGRQPMMPSIQSSVAFFKQLSSDF